MSSHGSSRLLVPSLVACLLALPALAVEIEKRDLFQAGAGGYEHYRIPGLVVTGRGVLLAYCAGDPKVGRLNRTQITSFDVDWLYR